MSYTKAGMLKYLKENIKTINILSVMVVSSKEFFLNESKIIQQVLNFAQGQALIVRSSSKMEDTEGSSNAGKFESILNVKPEYEKIKGAIQEVYASYDTKDDEEILIQPMLLDVMKSGVIFTADMDTYADYYIVNYYEGNDSAAVTSGNGKALKTFIRYKFAETEIEDNDLANLVEICKEIENFLGNHQLDIEFAIDSRGVVYILQVRPIVKGKKELTKRIDLAPILNRIYKKAQKLSAKHPFLLGDTTCFGVMPDWNPAEILGVRPKKLAISLYKELITDSIWAHQRADYGYRDVTMHPLMISFCGVPYIDTRITFNSFVPAELEDTLAEKLINYYLTKLSNYPIYHDKIEFEIVYSCYYFGIRNRLEELKKYGFLDDEIHRIEKSLLNLTKKIVNPKTGLYKRDIAKVETLKGNYEKIVASDISLVDKIYWLIEECKAYGTLPFAGVARAGFIAVQILKSLVSCGIISKDDYDAYMNSLDTVTSKMSMDLEAYYVGRMSQSDFLNTYGHIRPGTYDIMSKRYDEVLEEYFDKDSYVQNSVSKTLDFSFTVEQMRKIQEELEKSGLQIDAEELLRFIKEAIEGREYTKFVFTKTVSKLLQLIELLGERVELSKEEMAYLDISIVKQLYVDLYTGDIGTMFRENIRSNKVQYESAVMMKLPSIIVKPEDIYGFYLLNEEANYVTQKSVTAQVVVLDDINKECEGKIVFIQAADPGYDFLFTKNIKGLVTQFGGANSHMAIRCAELGIPAIIGAGEQNYCEWSKANRITLDCLKKQVIKIR